jgi:hypothetical protein
MRSSTYVVDLHHFMNYKNYIEKVYFCNFACIRFSKMICLACLNISHLSENWMLEAIFGMAEFVASYLQRRKNGY